MDRSRAHISTATLVQLSARVTRLNGLLVTDKPQHQTVGRLSPLRLP
jgi:hypothetical protein